MNASVAVVRRIGVRIRDLRLAAGFSMAALARASGVALGTLSRLESGDANPTIETLFALAGTLGAALGELIDGGTAGPIWVVRAHEGTRIEGAGGVDIRLLERLSSGAGVAEIYELRFAKGARHRSSPHAQGTVERILVHDGRLEVSAAGQTMTIGPAEYARFPGDVDHEYGAARSTTATLVMEFRLPARLRAPVRPHPA